MSLVSCDCDCTRACDEASLPTDPMESMRIGDLRILVDHVAHLDAKRRLEAQVMEQERNPLGRPWARLAPPPRLVGPTVPLP